MDFQLHLDPDSPPTPEESKAVKEAIRICGSPKRAVLAMLRLTNSLAVDLTNSQALLGNPLGHTVHYAAPSDDIEQGEHMYVDGPEGANSNATH